MEFILDLVIIILATKLAGQLSVKIGQPAVLGKLIVGILLGPAVLGWIHTNDFIHYFSEIGVILLMFIAGLETNVEQLRQNWKSALAVAIGGIILPFAGGFGVGQLFGLDDMYSLFIGIVCSATSVSISVQVLKELDRLRSPEGTTILGAAVVDDILVVLLLAMMVSFLGTSSESISLPLLISQKVLFFVVIIVIGCWVVPYLMKRVSRLKVTEPTISAALIICFGFAYFADWMGMAAIIGAFVAGIAVAQTPFKLMIESKTETIAYTIFVPVFLVSIGLNVSLVGLSQQIGFVIVLTIVAIITKLLGAAIGARLTGFSTHSSLAVGSGMISRGEVALIIAATGLQNGLLQQQYFTSVVLMIIMTTLVAPLLLKLFFQKTSRE